MLVNGDVDSMHPTEESAAARAHEIACEWKRESDLGSDARAPKLAVLSFNSWMQLQNELVF